MCITTNTVPSMSSNMEGSIVGLFCLCLTKGLRSCCKGSEALGQPLVFPRACSACKLKIQQSTNIGAFFMTGHLINSYIRLGSNTLPCQTGIMLPGEPSGLSFSASVKIFVHNCKYTRQDVRRRHRTIIVTLN